MADNPFDSIENAHEYVSLLTYQVNEVRNEIQENISEAVRDGAARRIEALRLVDYKLRQLTEHLAASCRMLNDLRTLRRLLLAERLPQDSSSTTSDNQRPDD